MYLLNAIRTHLIVVAALLWGSVLIVSFSNQIDAAGPLQEEAPAAHTLFLPIAARQGNLPIEGLEPTTPVATPGGDVQSFIGGRVWLDQNSNGVADPEENGIAHVELWLYTGDSILLATTTTDSTGSYLFLNMPGGSQVVRINRNTLPLESIPTYDPDGILNDKTPLAVPVNGKFQDIDFGYRIPMAVAPSVTVSAPPTEMATQTPNGPTPQATPTTTFTALPGATASPTPTAMATATATVLPAATHTVTATSTEAPDLPTDTPSFTPTPTSTSGPSDTTTPTATSTTTEPGATPTPTFTSLPILPTPTPTEPANPNVIARCADNEFRDLSANLCRKLDRPDLGFDFARYTQWLDPNAVINAACNESAFEAALAQASGGGIVQLPACTMEIGRINVPSQVVIQGAGIGQTILKGSGCDNSAPRRVLLIQDQSDVVLRDLSLDAGGRNCVMLEIDHATNVLVDRVKIYNSTEVGMRFYNGSRQVTIRYSEIHGNGELHGIGSKDCATGATIDSCPESKWTSSYSVHSNMLYDHGDHGMNLHGLNGEVAGNLSYANGHSGKFYDAQCVWAHHNQFRNNSDWNIFIAPTLDIPQRASHDLYFYKNQYLETPASTYSWGITYTGDHVTQPLASYTNIYVMQNEYASRLKTNDVPLSVCPGTVEDGLLSGAEKLTGNSATCNLSSYPSMGGNATIQPLGNCPAP